MYRYNEEEARKTPLARKLVRDHLAREVKGACIALAFPTVYHRSSR